MDRIEAAPHTSKRFDGAMKRRIFALHQAIELTVYESSHLKVHRRLQPFSTSSHPNAKRAMSCTNEEFEETSVMFIKTSAAACIVAAASFATVAAHADETFAAVAKTTVSYSDLDLSKDADAHKLYKRLERATAQVCGNSDLRDLRVRRLYEACFQETMGRAVDDVGHASVKAIFNNEVRVASRRTESNSKS